ncbi:uncharacterized protein SPPG_08488 [Spizellomyces punctatus DAOM BR117]|uniref:G-protein coupled receptors family 3 profile domain-containing protein n=1 Tax=Spizellomyces punctatus (strain DAOM BR117) TaxID=645134 RepID=A0A0L0H5D1_SPIPD|nr:uncharacterized protein SPPG_08488 [Spizellomyces punctatus DAOM BR117]KNC96101.1 hypothetical protein SPPG_08488 [Spizellomyces punctatus DAOM BR117]|eukprot:XP_016604141.1 hypothetical protein SPPG_08488 [Spizellomyces punctatus DAOM BR117]
MSILPSPYDEIRVTLAAIALVIQVCNLGYSSQRLVRRVTSFTLGLFSQQMFMLGFTIVNMIASRTLLADGEAHDKLNISGNVCYNFACLVHVLLLVKRFGLCGTRWDKPVWNRVMFLGTIVIFIATAGTGMGFAFYRLHRILQSYLPGMETLYRRVNTLLYAGFTLYLLVMDTILSSIMYIRLQKLRIEPSPSHHVKSSNLHVRTVYTMIVMVIMSWIGMTLVVVSSLHPSLDEKPLGLVMNQLAYVFASFHMTFACLYLVSIEQVLKGYGLPALPDANPSGMPMDGKSGTTATRLVAVKDTRIGTASYV